MLESLKAYLNIAFEDETTDKVLEGALKRGQAMLNEYAGAPQDYEEEGLARQLLFDYCRYVRSHAAEVFAVNFRQELIALRELAELKAAAGGTDEN